ncbi:hypothetical protein C1645_773361 [Glomus cerebriforme]|uniref:RNase III domain-containing protein n=1 Tax=Glomus cerebriforme TaxID=658196 RepID=A0A397T1R2_9GLOM|nr:hypothetical protein C1645_773361 [Glomus cerebriforme]
MFRFQQNFKNLKYNDFVTLQQQNQLSFRSSFNSRLLPSASYSTKRITLPEINNEKLRTLIFKNDKFYRFYGDKAYNYYAVRALNLKLTEANNPTFNTITQKLISREFLTEVAKVCELDKMLSLHSNNNLHLGEMMEAYCSGMLFNGMEEEMKKFASEVVDYYFMKENINLKKVIVNEQQKGVKMKQDEINSKNITNKVVQENNKEQQKEVKMKQDENISKKKKKSAKKKELKAENLLIKG